MDLVELGALECVVEPLGQRLDRRQVVDAARDLLHRRHRRVLGIKIEVKLIEATETRGQWPIEPAALIAFISGKYVPNILDTRFIC